MFLILVIALAAVGVGYALWSETLTIEGTVQTGEVDVEFSTHPVEECIDINGTLTCPEPPEKANAANCTVEFLGGETDPNGDNGANLLQVAVTGMYPGYHCKVGFDVTSTGTVPVHVWLPEATGDIPAWVATDFEGCYDDGVQLHQGGTTGLCTMDISFTNDDAVPENSGPITFGWTILATQFNEDPAAPGPVVLLEGSYAVVSSPVEIENLAGLDYEIVDNGDGSVTFCLWPTLFDGSPVLKALTVGIVNEVGDFSQDLTYGSSDGTPPVDELVSGDAGVSYCYTAPAGSLPSGEVGVFLMVNGRAPDDGNDLQRWIGIVPMTTANDFGGFDWSWANRFKITLP
jgi:predicted ribosomally synthesized peptide with SipW-like signal peptide